jgi:predicted ferric reductase
MGFRFPLTVAAIGLLVVPVQTWLMLGGDLTEYVRYDTLPGQLPYVFSKLCALFAIELVWLQAMLGLLRHRLIGAAALAPPKWRRVHTTLGVVALLVMAAHVALFVVGASMRNKHAAIDLLLPWGHGVYRTWVAFGAAALWLFALAAAVQLARLLSAAARQWVHRLTLGAIILVGIHSLAIGSESRSGAMVWMYGVMGVLLAAALLDRLGASRQRVRAGVRAVRV